MNESFEVIIDGEGNIEAKTIGIKGKTCDNVMSKIMVGIGAEDIKTGHTSEFFEDGDDPVKVIQQN